VSRLAVIDPTICRGMQHFHSSSPRSPDQCAVVTDKKGRMARTPPGLSDVVGYTRRSTARTRCRQFLAELLCWCRDERARHRVGSVGTHEHPQAVLRTICGRSGATEILLCAIDVPSSPGLLVVDRREFLASRHSDKTRERGQATLRKHAAVTHRVGEHALCSVTRTGGSERG